MPKALDFSDVILALFPRGALWMPSEQRYSYGTSNITGTFFANGTLTVAPPDDLTDLNFRAGDILTVSGIGALNVGDFTVASTPTATTLTIEGTFIADGPRAVTIERSIYAGALLRMVKGMADNHDAMQDWLADLATVREPATTPYLADLEREYGLLPDAGLTEDERRAKLEAFAYCPQCSGAADYLQARLNAGGFAVQVHVNSPAVDTMPFIGGYGGEVITNPLPYARDYDDAYKVRTLQYALFFIGGAATRNAEGQITDVARVTIPEAQLATFRSLVLRYKPVSSWAIAIVRDWDYLELSSDDTIQYSTTKGLANDDQTTGGYFWPYDYL